MSSRHSGLIHTHSGLAHVCEILSHQDLIAFDTEFIRETTFYPIIGLIQVATDSESWLIDPLALSKEELKPLFDVFLNPKILKVVHAAQGDQECLVTSFGILATPLLDTALAASLLGYGDNIGLGNLTKEVLQITLQKGHARTDWTKRPLPEQLQKYAHLDVQHLVRMARKLLHQLEGKERKTWALELSARYTLPQTFTQNSETLAKRLAKSGRLDPRSFEALKELIVWRDRRASQVNIPRRRIADDDVLMDLARVRPLNEEHLSSFRGINRGELKHSADILFEIFHRVNALPDSVLVPLPKPSIPTSRESRVMDVLQCYIKILADEHDIASRHLLTADDVLPLLRRGPFSSPQDLVDQGLLSPGSCRLIGDELLAFLRGGRSLCLENQEVKVKKE